jgi:kumamolisin
MVDTPADPIALRNSARPPMAGAVRIGAPDAETPIRVTLLLRRRPGGPALPALARRSQRPKALSRADFAAHYGAGKADVEKIASFCGRHGLAMIESSLGGRRAVLSGTVAAMERAFGVKLGTYRAEAVTYRGFEGDVRLAADMDGVVQHVVGLDDRPLGQPAIRRAVTPQYTTALSPADVATLYGFPAISAQGQTIGILEFGGGYLASDVATYFSTVANTAAPTVVSVDVGTAVNTPPAPGNIANADYEVALDIQVAGAIAPEAQIVVYFANNNEQGYIDAFSTALHDQTHNPSVISVSWGGAENGLASWTSSLTSVLDDAQSLGVTIFISSGDGGAGSPAEVSYPASDPNVTGCGGTTIENVSGSSFDQVAWGGSGGGVSNAFGVPVWQDKITIPASLNPIGHVGRGIPDVAGNGDPASGYEIIVAGASAGIWGGTSAVAPFYAGLIARLNAGTGEPAGFLNADLYAWAAENSGPFADVTSGNNDTAGSGYAAAVGWDAVTGWGSLNGTALFNLLGGYCARQRTNLNDAEFALQDAPYPGEIPGLTPAQYHAIIERLTAAVRTAQKALTACEAAHSGAARQQAATNAVQDALIRADR